MSGFDKKPAPFTRGHIEWGRPPQQVFRVGPLPHGQAVVSSKMPPPRPAEMPPLNRTPLAKRLNPGDSILGGSLVPRRTVRPVAPQAAEPKAPEPVSAPPEVVPESTPEAAEVFAPVSVIQPQKKPSYLLPILVTGGLLLAGGLAWLVLKQPENGPVVGAPQSAPEATTQVAREPVSEPVSAVSDTRETEAASPVRSVAEPVRSAPRPQSRPAVTPSPVLARQESVPLVVIEPQTALPDPANSPPQQQTGPAPVAARPAPTDPNAPIVTRPQSLEPDA